VSVLGGFSPTNEVEGGVGVWPSGFCLGGYVRSPWVSAQIGIHGAP